MDTFAIEWWKKEEQKRKERRNAGEAQIINRVLSGLIQELRYKFVKDESIYDEGVNKANRHLVQSTIWNVGYLNNLENPIVAVLQYYFILAILEKENIEDTRYYEHEANRMKNRLMMSFNIQRELQQFKLYFKSKA